MTKKLAIVMAAGKGTRMKSELPKVLVPALGRPIIDYVLDALEESGIDETVVIVGYRADDVKIALAGRKNLSFALQEEQRGTGHAVMCARAALERHHGPVLVVTGDSPMLQPSSVRALFEEFERRPTACLMGTAHKENPYGLGRVVRDANGDFLRIVEEKDASEEERRLTEVNMSTYLFDAQELLQALGKLQPNNKQGEYYITDGPGILKDEGKRVAALAVLKPVEALSINTVDDLAAVEAALREEGKGEKK
ncbi:MAG: NTP transferase domain-containing protein [Planctomycetia bacterium]|nr:NTP transferase domain-containing protein [Planctomycetia bacterium]